jgi:hypothetical protein
MVPAVLRGAADTLSGDQVAQLLALLAQQPKTVPAAGDVAAAASPAAPTSTDAVTQQGPTAITGTDAAVASSPVPGPTPWTAPAPVSSVPAVSGPVTSLLGSKHVVTAPGALVVQSFTPPGQDHRVDRFGIVVAVDDQANTAQVSWFLADPTTVDGSAITKVS